MNMSKLKPVLFLGIAGGVVAAVRKRASKEQLEQAAGKVSNLADQARQAAPAPVQQAVDTAVEKVTEAASNVTGGEGDDSGERDSTRRFSAPAEAGAQPPAESGGAPSDEAQPTQAHSIATEEADPSLDETRAHKLPEDVVMPDVSDDDPSVQEAEAAAAADARSIGRNADENQP
jgi:type II secretory pathway pseudopilin PulG